MSKVLIIATSRKTRGGITAVIKAHEKGKQWEKYHCYWIQTHKDGNPIIKIAYLLSAWLQFIILIPFYDMIHVHGTGGSSAKRKLPFIYIAKLLKKKIIFHFHPSSPDVLHDKSSHVLKRIFDLSDIIIALSPQWARWINDAIPNNRYDIRIVWNPCPTVKRDISKKKKHILFAGSIIKRKGYDILIKAFSQIAKSFPDWQLIFAGNGEINEGKSLSNKLKINSQVQWLGWVNGKAKETAFQEACIYCLASTGEGFPMGVLDAWAYGIPCIMTPVGGIPDIVTDGKNGLLFPIGNPDILSLKIKQLIQDKELRTNISKESDKLVYGIFSLNQVNKSLEQIYDELSMRQSMN